MAGYNYGNYPAFNPGYTPVQPWQGAQPYPQQIPQPPQNNFQPQQQANTNQPAFICCPVTSREEAVAQRVEAFGPGLLMPDLGHGTIYFKKFNNETAIADFGEFRYVRPQPPEETKAPALDFNAIISTFTSRLDGIEQKMDVIAGSIMEKKLPVKPKAETKGAAEK